MEQRLSESFYNLYRGLGRAYGVFTETGEQRNDGKHEGRAKTMDAPYVEQRWVDHLTGEKGLGVIPVTSDGTCFWAAIDIDDYAVDLQKLSAKIEKENLPFILIRSKSGGAHVTAYFGEPISCKDARELMTTYAGFFGYPRVEIFPKQTHLKDEEFGNWLNMPYFGGISKERCAIVNGEAITHPEKFLKIAITRRMTESGFYSLLAKARYVAESDEFYDGPVCLSRILEKGGAEEGTRNDTAFAVAVFVKKKFGERSDERSQYRELADKITRSPLSDKELEQVWASAKSKGYNYPCTRPALKCVCNRDACRKKKYGIKEKNDDDEPKEMGYVITSVAKIMSEPVLWRITINEDHVIQCTTDEWTGQRAFLNKVAECLNEMVPPIKANKWAKIVSEAMNRCVEVEAPIETRVGDRVVNVLLSMIASMGEVLELDEFLHGRVYRKDRNLVFFYGDDLLEELNRRSVIVPISRAYDAVNCVGGGKELLTIKGSEVETWWINTAVASKKILRFDDYKEVF